ncbi:fimbrial biogenesis chaperone [Glaciimonas sp. GG7]
MGLQNNSMGSSFNANPIGFNLSAERPSGVLQISNTGDDPIRIQVSPVEWKTDGHEEVLIPTDALLLNPPIFSLEPGKVQFMRFGIRHPDRADTEKTYRLLVDEVPDNDPKANGLKTVLHISIPIFVAPKTLQGKISWELKQGKNGLVLDDNNDSNVHSKILQIQINNTDNPNTNDGIKITPSYVLSGQHKEWSLDSGKLHAGKVKLHIQTDEAETDEYLTLEADQLPGR